MKVKSLSCVRLLATPWTAAHQAPPSMGFSSQEYWSGVLLPSPGLVTKSCPILATPWTVTCQAPPWDSPGKNTGVGSHFLLQGIFPIQGSNLGLLHCRQFLYWTELHVGFNGCFVTALPLKHSLLSRKGKEQVKQCNQLNPKYEKSNRTSDQFLQQIGGKERERGSGGEREKEK